MKRSILKQSLKQLWGIIVLEYKYHDRLPDIENYQSINQYSLPFEGKWTVVNGGVTEKLSHSWEIPTQRYAYDFVILDENGKSFLRRRDRTVVFLLLWKRYIGAGRRSGC